MEYISIVSPYWSHILNNNDSCIVHVFPWSIHVLMQREKLYYMCYIQFYSVTWIELRIRSVFWKERQCNCSLYLTWWWDEHGIHTVPGYSVHIILTPFAIFSWPTVIVTYKTLHIQQNFPSFHDFHSITNVFLQVMVMLISNTSPHACYSERFPTNIHFLS